ncbi:MAG: IPTL-CTERM sorting domain-containing protein [Gammaproteobacteria bacterium]
MPTNAGNLDATLNCTGEAAPTPSGTITDIDFGDQDVSVASAPQDATLTSNGTADLIVSGAATLPTNPSGVFAIGTNNCTNGLNLSTNGTCTVSVTCTPAAVGPVNGVLRVPTNAGDQDSTLTCNGIAPSGIISGINFGDQNVTETSTAQNSTVTSNGTAALVLSGDAVLFDDAGGVFAIDTNNCTNGLDLGTSGTCTVAVTCTPALEQLYTGTLRVPTNDPDNGGNLDATLTCTGVVPVPDPVISPPTQLTLQAPVGEVATGVATLGNDGTADLENISPSVTGPFTIDSNNCPTDLAPTNSCTIVISCTATDTAQTGELSIAFDNANTQTIALSCAAEDDTFPFPIPGTGTTKPIPTLSQWGIILMSGLLGFATLLAGQRRRR